MQTGFYLSVNLNNSYCHSIQFPLSGNAFSNAIDAHPDAAAEINWFSS